jgi:hypothetical protein
MTCKMGYVRMSTTSSSYPLMERKERDALQQSLVVGFQLLEEDIQWKMVSEMNKMSKMSKTT